VLVTTIVETPLSSATTLPLPTIPLITHLQQTPVPTTTTIPSSSLQNLPNFGSLFKFDHRLKTLETDFSEFKQTNQFASAVSSIPGIVDAYLANKMHEAVKTADQDKKQVKAQVYKILPKIEKTVNEQLEAEVLTRSSNESKTSHVVAANLSEFELKKILIDKMESNKSIHISENKRISTKHWLTPMKVTNSYLTRMEILSPLKDVETMRIKMKNPPLDQTGGPREEELEKNQSQLVHQRKRPPRQLASQLKGPNLITSLLTNQPDKETSQLHDWFQKLTKPPTPNRDWNKTLDDAHGPVQPWLSTLTQMEDLRDSFNELMDTPLDFSAFIMNRLKVENLTLELLAGPTFELMKGSCKSLVELECLFEEVYKATIDQLDWNNPEDVYSKRRIIAVTKLQIVEWHNYKHLDWITVRRDDDKLYTFKEGDFNRLCIQDIEDMLLLLVQGKLTNLTVEERLAFNVSLRMFTRSIVIQRRVEDL
ncbi:hypothetical protein Tco_1454710, partial [Tanacetum coccineum]